MNVNIIKFQIYAYKVSKYIAWYQVSLIDELAIYVSLIGDCELFMKLDDTLIHFVQNNVKCKNSNF